MSNNSLDLKDTIIAVIKSTLTTAYENNLIRLHDDLMRKRKMEEMKATSIEVECKVK